MASQADMQVAGVYCGEYTSFVLLRATDDMKEDELYSWGATKGGLLGRDIS